jgi:hypothetical protein
MHLESLKAVAIPVLTALKRATHLTGAEDLIVKGQLAMLAFATYHDGDKYERTIAIEDMTVWALDVRAYCEMGREGGFSDTWEGHLIRRIHLAREMADMRIAADALNAAIAYLDKEDAKGEDGKYDHHEAIISCIEKAVDDLIAACSSVISNAMENV